MKKGNAVVGERYLFVQQNDTLSGIHEYLDHYEPELDPEARRELVFSGLWECDEENTFSFREFDPRELGYPSDKECVLSPRITLGMIEDVVEQRGWDPRSVRFLIPENRLGSLVITIA